MTLEIRLVDESFDPYATTDEAALEAAGVSLFRLPTGARYAIADARDGERWGDARARVAAWLARSVPPLPAGAAFGFGRSKRAEGVCDVRVNVLSSGAMIDPLLYEAAVRIVTETRRCSPSWLQRKLFLSYKRAARIVEMMERRGVVGPANHEVLASPPETSEAHA